ncbi:lipopolysaccharide kinase InaA family protein [Odoribacter lunatus]|uniref:lipopolysaccharide kinase InaA family protein n=1 Tax=Odoribacter lunatus TaxID=2941335 RepID=UPI00203C6871|nr:lipopolysaccharide kinase InaA family protein [Odoribacter lunatus]
MSKKIVLHTQYSYLQTFISRLPEIFLFEGEYIHDGRNKIKVFEVEGLKINVKRYRIPLLINRFAYLYLRQTKAERAYEYALQLQVKGINTPTPIAYIIEKNKGLLAYSYFISLHVPYPRRFYEFGNSPLTEANKIIFQEFGKYTAQLHEKGIYHQDYSPGNILFDLKNDKPEFCIIDINRMHFGPVSLKKGCANFTRLWGPPEMFRIIAQAYAQTRGMDINTVCTEILTARQHYWKKAIRKRPAEFPLEF